MLLPVFAFLLQGDALPCTHDNIFHSYRVVAMREMLRHGWLFSRWVPNLALGYGYPFFTYREPLPYLLGEGLFALGVPLPLVLGGLYAASLLAGALGAYVLAHDLFGPRAAFVSAVAYGLAPYVLMDVLRRGNMPESVGLALLPWLFVVMRRLILDPRRGRFVLVVALLSALFLSHNISSLLLAPFLGLYVVVLAAIWHERGGWPYAFAAVGVAVLLTAWFWLPALTEQDAVQLHLSRSTRNNDFRYNFASWREMLLTVPAPYDPAYVNPPMRVPLGLGRVALAVVGGLVGLWRARDRETRWLVALMLVAGLGYLWMATPGSLGVWEAVPLLSFVQFPWRFVGRALLPASLLAGLAVETLVQDSVDRAAPPGWRRWLSTAAVLACAGALMLLAWPESYPPKGMCGMGRYPGLATLYAREREGWMGMDPESSYFPIWVEVHPEDTALAAAFEEGRLPARFDGSTLPEGAEVVSTTYRPLNARLTIRSPEDFRARWLGFYYPGWRVTVDGEPVPIAPEDDTGLLRFDVPAGEHEVRVRFGLTPIRATGSGLAVVGAAAGVGVLLSAGLWEGIDGGRAVEPQRHPEGTTLLLAMAALSVGALALRYGLAGRVATPWTRSRLARGELPEVSTALGQSYEGGLRLLGYTLASDRLPGDGELTVSLLWQADRRPDQNLRTSVLLRGEDGEMWSPAGTVRPRGYEPPPPSGNWEAGAYVYDPHIVIPNPGTPPGTYEVVVAVFDEDTLAPLSPVDGNGHPVGTDLVIGNVTLTEPSRPLDLAAFGLSEADRLGACGPIELRAFALDRAAGIPGDLLAVRWVWEAAGTPDQDLVATLAVVGPDGEVAETWSLSPVADWWPTSRWRAGERWAGQQVVRLPGNLESGLFEVRVLIEGCEGVLAREELAIVAPDRIWSVPEGLETVDVDFEDQLALVGYGLTAGRPAAGDTVGVTLAWRGVASMETSYLVFLHLVAEDGTLVDQDDGEPAGWSRPTTGWAVGEVVVERRSVTLPSEGEDGPYQLRVGVYGPDGSRLATDATGTDSYVLETLPSE